MEAKERNSEVDELNSRLRERERLADRMEKEKAEVMRSNLTQLETTAGAVEVGLKQALESENAFVQGHMVKKNQKLGELTQRAEQVCGTMSQYVQTQLGEVTNKLNAAGEATLKATKQVTQELTKQTIPEAAKLFEEERARLNKELNDTACGVQEEVVKLRVLMREGARARAEGEKKLGVMVGELQEELGRMLEEESKEGEMTFDCLLKLVEDSCTRIREAQLR